MATKFDFSEAVIIFAEYMGVGFDALSEYCRKTKYVGSVDALAHEIYQIPQTIFDIVSKKKSDANNNPCLPKRSGE